MIFAWDFFLLFVSLLNPFIFLVNLISILLLHLQFFIDSTLLFPPQEYW